MSDFLRWILDIERIPADVPWSALHLGWERTLPGWFWGLVFFGLGLLAVWSYGRLTGNRTGRGILAGARFVLLFFLILVIAGPTLVYPREHIERDWVVMLMDRSQSMNVADTELANGRAGRISRDAQLAQLLRTSGNAIQSVQNDHETYWLGFDRQTHELRTRSTAFQGDPSDIDGEPNTPAGEIALPILGRASGSRTSLSTSLAQAVRKTATRPVSGIVLFSDGRTDDPPNRELIRQLQANAIPVFVVPLGNPQSLGDVAIREITAPARAFVHDQTPVEVSLDHLGSTLERSGATITLTDEATGAILDQQRIESGQNTAEADSIILTATPKEAGQARWVVKIDTDIPDLIEDNNIKTIDIDLIDRPIRVLYVEGYPRWEYHYLKWMLMRETTIDSSIILLSADRDFAQEGNTRITRLPNSPEELDPYDVVIIGDVRADFFAPRQLEMLYDHIAERGAGLLWLAGWKSNPSTYSNTAIASLLPMRSSASAGFQRVGIPVTAEPTPLADNLGLFQIMDQDGSVAWPTLSNPNNKWNQFQWVVRLDPAELKPTAEVLLRTVETFPSAADGLPLFVRMRFGAGQTVFAATDEIWRWRYGRGERLPEQVWIPIIRALGRDRISTSGRSATVSVEPRRVQVGQPAVIELRLFDEEMVERGYTRIPAEITDTDSGKQRIAEITLHQVEGAPGRFVATYLPDRTGDFNVQFLDPPFNQMNLSSSLDVYRQDDEMQQPETDHSLLARLAEQTGGAVISPEDFQEQLPQQLPNRTVRTQMDVVEALWDTPIVLLLFLFLLTFEWVGRKVMRLV